MRVPYGPTEIEHVDIYKTKRADCQRSSAGSEPVGPQGNGISSIPAEAGSVPSTNRLTSVKAITIVRPETLVRMRGAPHSAHVINTNGVLGTHRGCASECPDQALNI